VSLSGGSDFPPPFHAGRGKRGNFTTQVSTICYLTIRQVISCRTRSTLQAGRQRPRRRSATKRNVVEETVALFDLGDLPQAAPTSGRSPGSLISYLRRTAPGGCIRPLRIGIPGYGNTIWGGAMCPAVPAAWGRGGIMRTYSCSARNNMCRRPQPHRSNDRPSLSFSPSLNSVWGSTSYRAKRCS